MSTIEALTLVCLVAHQVGVVRNVPRSTISDYPNAITFPCNINDYQALDYYRSELRAQQEQQCPNCFPWH